MAGRPSDTEILKAVEAYAGRRGAGGGPAVPGAATLTWTTLLDFRIVRSLKTHGERPMREPGSRDDVANRPTYTVLDSHPVPPPEDPEQARSWLLVREGSLGEEPCAGCEGGTNKCGACRGRGVRDCPRFVDCPVCEAGPDACWECEGTGRSRSRRPPHRRPGTSAADRAARVRCVRCRIDDVACPKCRGRRQLDCPDCNKSGQVECTACSGAKRVTHPECRGTGRFTVWTEGWIRHTPHRARERRLGRRDLRRATGSTGHWHENVLRRSTDKLPDDLDESDEALLAPHLTPRRDEVARRATLRRLPLAHVRVHADPHRDYFAFPTHTDIVVLSRPTGERVRHFAALATAAILLVTLVAVLTMVVLR
ncbi:hypothetical protein [Streptomyces sp. 351MFTsu5.1]|uniref:hypothetical protein n=1 Tax=Streptomyces sp. 351MFTsu5.1 TaxID=1172180 RepID=UPI000365F514|nr:hypothetical protein [Streptomyces sp. 351MFTsu5.1]